MLLFLLLLELDLLLFGFSKQSFLNIAEMGVLQSRELLKLVGPSRGDVADFPGSTDDGTSYKVLICVHQFMVLQTQ